MWKPVTVGFGLDKAEGAFQPQVPVVILHYHIFTVLFRSYWENFTYSFTVSGKLGIWKFTVHNKQQSACSALHYNTRAAKQCMFSKYSVVFLSDLSILSNVLCHTDTLQNSYINYMQIIWLVVYFFTKYHIMLILKLPNYSPGSKLSQATPKCETVMQGYRKNVMNCDFSSKPMDHTIFRTKFSSVQVNISWDIKSSHSEHSLITRCNQSQACCFGPVFSS